MSKLVNKNKFGKSGSKFGNKGHQASDEERSDGFDSDHETVSHKSTAKAVKGQPKHDLGNNDDDNAKTTKTGAKFGKKRPPKPQKQAAGGEGDEPEAPSESEDDDDDKNDNKKLTDHPDEAANDIKQSFTKAGIRPPAKLRRLGTVRLEDLEAIQNEEAAAGEADPEFIGGVQEAMDEVETNIRKITLRTKGINDQRRTSLCIDNPETAQNFTEALKIVVSDGEVKAALAKAGLKVGTVGIRVLAAIGGLAIVGAGCFLAIVSVKAAPAKIASSIASQVVSAGEWVDDKVEQRFEKNALKKANAQELIRLIGTNEEAVVEQNTITPEALRKYGEFKLMVAAMNAEKMAALGGSKSV